MKKAARIEAIEGESLQPPIQAACVTARVTKGKEEEKPLAGAATAL